MKYSRATTTVGGKRRSCSSLAVDGTNKLYLHATPPQPDPLVELRGKELDIKADDVQRKREEFAQRQQFDAMKAMQGNQLAEQRLVIQKDIAMMKDNIAKERMGQAAQFKAMDIMRGNK
jgi:hypothetical protein